LNKLISPNTSKANPLKVLSAHSTVLINSNFVPANKSVIGLLGKIGNTAPEKTNNCKAASHSL